MHHGFCGETLEFVDNRVQGGAQGSFDPVLPEPFIEVLVPSESDPAFFEGFRVRRQQPGFGLHDRIADTWYVETDGWRSSGRRFGDDEPPALPGSGMKQDARLAHETVLLVFRDEPGALDPPGPFLLQSFPVGSITGDC